MMKPSHLRCPRTARDGIWAAWGDAIERPSELEWNVVHIVIAIIGLGVVAALILGVI